MEFKTIAHKLVARICAYCQENRLPDPGQVRTTKLVYLVECEFFGWERKRLSDLDWIFLHYGPWSPTLSAILKEDFAALLTQRWRTGDLEAVVHIMQLQWWRR